MKVLITQARPEDARKISYLIYRNTDQVKENNYSLEQITAWKKYNTPGATQKALQHKVIFCAYRNQRLVGTIALNGSEITGLYVSYSKRGLGIGKQLLNHLERFASRKGVSVLTLTSTPSACRFYTRNGYKSGERLVVIIYGARFHETEMTKVL